ncbi:MAG: hypothetical protein AAGC71_13605, partial [Pseudomonadota bacterium]
MRKRNAMIAPLVACLSACVAHAPVIVTAPAPVTTETVAGGAASGSGIAQSIPAMPGISGMARLDDARFIVVQDKKAFESGNRLGLVEFDRQAPSIRYVPMPFPATSGGRTSDL